MALTADLIRLINCSKRERATGMQKISPGKNINSEKKREKRRRGILENSLPKAIYHGPTNVSLAKSVNPFAL